MEPDNPFDLKLESLKRMPLGMRDASILVTDTLDLAWASARSVFGTRAKPEHALALLPTFLAEAATERQRLEADSRDRMSPADAPPSASHRPGTAT